MNLPHALDGLLALLQAGRGGGGVRAEKHRVPSEIEPNRYAVSCTSACLNR
jgi:hypothetical protein